MWGEVSEALKSRQVVGYAFYHMQNTSAAAAGYTLYIGYGSVDEEKLSQAEVGRVVAEAVRKNGLTVDWDGNPSQNVGVAGMTWRKRRVNELPLTEEAE